MASASPLPTRDSSKTSVVVILADATVALHSPSNNNILQYINPLHKHLSEAGYPRQPIYLGLVRYGSVHCSGSPVWIVPFSLVGAHNAPTAGHIITETSSGVAALDGYATAIKMIDNFRRTPKQNPNEEYSYHLWHISAGLNEDEEAAYPYISFSQAIWNLTWETVPTELQSCNIKLSMILLSPCPRFSALFSVVSDENIKPWFDTCPRHEFLLSGFDLPSQLGDAMPSTALVKRLADSDPLAEHPPQRLNIEDTSQPSTASPLALADPLTLPSSSSLSYTSPTVSKVKASDLPTQSPPHEVQDVMDDQWSGVLFWSYGESDVCASVVATDRVRNPWPSIWPTVLRLEIFEAGTSALDIQAWIHRHKAPLARVQCASEMHSQDFGELVRSLREGKCVAIARWEIEAEGTSKAGLVLAPFNGDLLCAAFPASDIPELPKPWLQQPQEETELQADYPPPANSL